MQDAGTVLVVDDDPLFRALLAEVFATESYVVVEAESAQEAIDMVAAAQPDVMLLDLNLDGSSGFDVLRALPVDSTVGVIVVSGHQDAADRVACLEMGADDFVTKPVLPRELVARVRAVSRRTQARPEPMMAHGDRAEFGPLTIDLAAREAMLEGQVVPLTAKEFDLLRFLAASPRRVYSRQQILNAVWGSADWRSGGTVAEHVRRLRLKLAETGSDHDWITTLKGAGYRFEPLAQPVGASPAPAVPGPPPPPPAARS